MADELGPLDPWAAGTRPGELRPGLRLLVVLAAVVTVVGMLVAPRAVWAWNGGFRDIDPFMFRNLLAVAVATGVGLCLLPESSVSRSLRLAVLLPLAHAIAMLVAWYEWRDLHLQTWLDREANVPIGAQLAATLAGCAVVSWAIAPPRAREVLHAAVMLALSGLLLLGLWLPIACEVWGTSLGRDDVTTTPNELLVRVLAPPFVAATVFTAVALRWPRWLLRARPQLLTALLTLFAIALAVRSSVSATAATTFAQFSPIVGACALAALIALAVLAGTIVVRRYRDARILRRGRTGTVADDDGPTLVACFELTSWLRGLRVRVRSFTARTADGDLPVPGSARLAMPVPLGTTGLRTGEAATAIQRADPIVIGGYVQQTTGDDPFRRAELLAPGPGGAVIGHAARLDSPLTEAALLLWRPCVAYLVIASVVALPALIGTLSH